VVGAVEEAGCQGGPPEDLRSISSAPRLTFQSFLQLQQDLASCGKLHWAWMRTLTPTEVDMVTVVVRARDSAFPSRTCPMAEDTCLRRRWRRVLGVTGALGAVEEW
jgi:hypothetical protein